MKNTAARGEKATSAVRKGEGRFGRANAALRRTAATRMSHPPHHLQRPGRARCLGNERGGAESRCDGIRIARFMRKNLAMRANSVASREGTRWTRVRQEVSPLVYFQWIVLLLASVTLRLRPDTVWKSPHVQLRVLQLRCPWTE